MNGSKLQWPRGVCARILLCGGLAAAMIFGPAAITDAQNWEQDVDFIRHDVYQAVNSNGTGAYAGGFPFRLRGVVLNNTEDWLDPTAAYDPGLHLFELGGQAEFYVQAVDLAGDTWDDGDFGGTACWIGQNYGNHVMHQEPVFSYTDAQWYAELDRLQLWYEGSTAWPLVRAGNLVEIRVRAGLYYSGKMNVNERHLKDPIYDFEVVILDEDYGLPTPTPLALEVLKNAADAAIFDPTRASGGEHYQSTLLEICNVRFLEDTPWASNTDLTLIDATGRTLGIHLGLNESFDLEPTPEGYFHVVGILDQLSPGGTGDYRLLAMQAADFSPVPEPGSVALLAAGAVTFWIGARQRRRRKARTGTHDAKKQRFHVG
ncbi:MAG TPA: PEP-CTERM sorting domain-containing protein [Thermoguttaceae bacterium]|nr:PEP-CTERM sorting domain-containing protein [Thermoguttaceae bacterium]